MIRSMTGYGRASAEVAAGAAAAGTPGAAGAAGPAGSAGPAGPGDEVAMALDVEVRTVNHRYLDLRLRLPRSLAGLEPELRSRVGRHVRRGKVDVTVSQGAGGPAQRLELDLALADRYVQAAKDLGARHGVEAVLPARELLALPGVARLAEAEVPSEAAGRALAGALDTALEQVVAMRAAEGAALARELRERLARVEALAAELGERTQTVQEQARERLRVRAEALARETGILDEARLHQEVVLAAGRLDVTEEVVRLRSHVEQFRAFLDGAETSGEAVGRRLDFLCQELGREANTVGAKSADAPVAHGVVELKSEIERLREQVQNLE